MKLVRFGSFPLVQIRKEEHECLDKYLLKHFSDTISFSNAITNLSIMKNTFYITPEKVVSVLSKNNNLTAPNRRSVSGDMSISNDYIKYQNSVKRAFKILKTFYIQLADAPFYKGMVYYPIYMEKYIRDSSVGSAISSQYKFNFILLTNNLIKDDTRALTIDESAVINVLYIFIHLFKSDILFNETSRSRNPVSFSSFNKKHLVQVMRFYKLIQKFDLNPVTVFLAIYDLIAFSKTEYDANPMSSYNNFSSRLSERAVQKFNPDDTKFRGIVKTIANKIEVELQRLAMVGEDFRSTDMVLNIIEIMLEHNEINDFIENLNKTKYSRDTRMELVADYNHYQPIIKLFEDLVQYNDLGLKDIIQDHEINFNKDIILTGDTTEANLTTLRGAIDRALFDKQYKAWQDDCISFINSTIKKLIEKQLQKEINIFYDFNNDPEYVKLKKDRIDAIDDLTTAYKDLKAANIALAALGTPPPGAPVSPDILAARKLVADINARMVILNNNISTLKNQMNTKEAEISNIRNNISTTILDKVGSKLSDLVYAFGNIYEDLSNIFLNPLMLNLFLTNKDFRQLFNLGEANYNLNCQDLERVIEKFDEISLKIKTTNAIESQSLSVIGSLFQQLKVDLNYLMDMYLNIIETLVDSTFTNAAKSGYKANSAADITQNKLKKLLSAQDYSALTKGFVSSCYTKVCFHVFKPMLLKLSRVQVQEQNQLQYSHELEDIHPVLGKMARNINNFKSFIFGTTTLETLYDLIVLTKEKLFFNGLLKKPLHKLNSPESKIKYVLDIVLGLNQNTIWVIGNGKVRLNMPDYLSMTGIPFSSDIKQSQLRSICKLDAKKYWMENNIGNDYKFDNKVNLKAEKEAYIKAEKDYKNSSNDPQKLIILKKAKATLDAKTKELENTIDNNLGNIGLNITKASKTNFYGPGGFGDEIERKIKTTITEEEYFEKHSELEQLGKSQEEIKEELEKQYAVLPGDLPSGVGITGTQGTQGTQSNTEIQALRNEIQQLRAMYQSDPKSYITYSKAGNQ
jgi:hypothetical protein